MDLKDITKEYKKYRWFFTSSNKLVIGGKSAAQNDELLKKLKSANQELLVMHTALPGSPFSIILSPINQLIESDKEETAIFTGCFSRAWKQRKSKTHVDLFLLSSLSKSKGMKTGSWLVKQKLERKTVVLELALTKQKDTLRAVPIKIPKKNQIILKIKPGKLDKTNALSKLQVEATQPLSQNEVLSALPSGGISILK